MADDATEFTIPRISTYAVVDLGPRAELTVASGQATSGLSTLIKDHLAGGASRLAALLLPQILPVFSVVAPCHPGAALRDLVLVQRGQATSERRSGLSAGRCRVVYQGS